MYAWMLRNAEGPRAWQVLAIVAFAESSFFPLPADAVVVPMVLANRKRAFAIAAWATFWSVAGGVLGYAIGYLLYDSVGLLLIGVFGGADTVEALRRGFIEHAWVMLLQGLTPIPYKLVTISAGIAGMSFWLFMLFSTITRGFRYLAEATVLYLFGDHARRILDRYLGTVLAVVLAVIVAALVAVRYVF
jgi:membrane protein YqaA with SNARE-associated domain